MDRTSHLHPCQQPVPSSPVTLPPLRLADVTDEASYPRLVQEVQDVVKGNGLNLLINNAGATSRQLLHELTSEQMRHMFDINCVAPLMLAKVSSAGTAASPKPSQNLMRKISCTYYFIFSRHIM